MLMKLFFILSSLSLPVAILIHQEAVGFLTAMMFLLIAAYFSKPRFRLKGKE